MRKFICLVFVCLVILCYITQVNSKFRLRRAIKKVKKAVRKVVKPVIEKPIKNILEKVGLKKVKKKVKKTYKEFKQETVHARVIFTENSYRVEKVTPCEAEHHDIVKAEKPTRIHFKDHVVIFQDRYCRKCGEQFYSKPKTEL